MKNRITPTIDRRPPRAALPPRAARSARATLLGALLAAWALAGGCNILGPAGYFVMGPDKIKRMYALEKDRPTVIFIDDRASVLPDRTVRRQIGMIAQQRLLDEGALTDLISTDSALAVAGRDSFSSPLSIVEIGQAVRADVVIYATIDTFALSTDGVTYEPTAAARIKVIDVVTGERVFPGETQHFFPISITLNKKQGSAPASSGERRAAQRDLAERLGVVLANVFIDHHPPDDSRVTGEGRE